MWSSEESRGRNNALKVPLFCDCLGSSSCKWFYWRISELFCSFGTGRASCLRSCYHCQVSREETGKDGEGQSQQQYLTGILGVYYLFGPFSIFSEGELAAQSAVGASGRSPSNRYCSVCSDSGILGYSFPVVRCWIAGLEYLLFYIRYRLFMRSCEMHSHQMLTGFAHFVSSRQIFLDIPQMTMRAL